MCIAPSSTLKAFYWGWGFKVSISLISLCDMNQVHGVFSNRSYPQTVYSNPECWWLLVYQNHIPEDGHIPKSIQACTNYIFKKWIHEFGWLRKRDGSGKSWGRRVNMTKIQRVKSSKSNLKTHQSTLKNFEDAVLLIELNIHPEFNSLHKNKQAHSSHCMKNCFTSNTC